MHIALYKPEIPPNTGNIARLCVLTGSPLHIIGEPSFSLDESAVRRAGLDYWDRLTLYRHKDWALFRDWARSESHRIFLLSRFAKTLYTKARFQSDDVLVFGSESKGLPEEIVAEIRGENPERLLRIPVRKDVRSLNLSNAAAIVLYEALRQADFADLETIGSR